VAEERIEIRNELIKKAIIKHLKRNLKTRYGMFSDKQGELKGWFERHLDDIIPMAFGPKNTLGRQIVNKVFVEGRRIDEVAEHLGKSKSTVYNHIDIFFGSLVDALSDNMYETLTKKAESMQMWRLKACPRCKGDMYYDDAGGVVSRSSEWACIQCGERVPHDTRPPVTTCR
jgi:hypothetical protein